MNDLNWYLMNKDHDFGPGGGGPVISKPANMHLIGMNPPPVAGEDKLTKFAKIKPSISRERVGLNPNQLLINL